MRGRDATKAAASAVVVLALLAATAGCSAEEAGIGPAPSASAALEREGGAATEPPTCETLISAVTVEALSKQGWTPHQRDFAIGPDVVSGGLECAWADYSVASDRGLRFGWAPITAEAAAAAQEKLIAQGWQREDGDRGVYVTVDPQFALAKDDDGYGMTYLFGDGWVTVSDTRQGLLLIDVPGTR